MIIIDFLNINDAQEWVTNELQPLPLLWYALFSEASPAENLQWLLIGAACVAMAAASWRYRLAGARTAYAFAGLLTVGLFLMLIEDSLNLRHVVVDHYFPILFGMPENDIPRTYRVTWELSFYSLLATMMASGFLYFWLRGILQDTGLQLLTMGYLLYGLAGFSSALRSLGDWQERLGHWVIDRWELADLPAWSEALTRMELWKEASETYSHTLGYLLTDHLFEESLELLAATLLAAGFLNLQGRMVPKTEDG
ncbi:hypothetical protein M0534_12880 [Methylonatrum kenyense]|uniref:hypothetical protein n=1 Tax=Methylonatrum kenyense TaxID=455253 RepID=UPI0020BE69C6|nr:hypothetical protein [Methylonatrum kenyense]MCK8517210.1 hypothetical protein [Methylonatrum kenyense]